MDITTLRIAATLASFAAFLAVVGWALWRGHAARFEEAARLPFDHEGEGA